MMQQITNLYLAFFLLCSSSVMAQLDSPEVQFQRLDSLVLQVMTEKQIPGLAYAILQKNEITHRNVFGFSNLDHNVPTKEETVFELASLTKHFIAVAILQLEERGLVDLDASISQYLDSLPEAWKYLTLHQLLTHTAGLAPQHAEWKTLKEGGWPKYVSRKDLWNAATQDSIYADPGEKFIYHNTGYFLATTIIEKLTKQDHREYFRKNIFDPLGMKRTFFEDQLLIVPDLASGYTLRDRQLCKIWRVGQEEIGGGQGLYANLPDLVRWIVGLNTNKIISETTKLKLFTPIQFKDSTTFHYGLGWFLPIRNGIQYHYHNGITGPEILRIPSYDLDIIVLTNLGEGEFDSGDYWGAANRIAEFLIPDFRYQPIAQVLPKELEEIIPGNYAYSDGSLMTIEIYNNKIVLDDDWGRDELIYIGDRTLSLTDNPVCFQFTSDDTICVIDEVWETVFATRIQVSKK